MEPRSRRLLRKRNEPRRRSGCQFWLQSSLLVVVVWCLYFRVVGMSCPVWYLVSGCRTGCLTVGGVLESSVLIYAMFVVKYLRLLAGVSLFFSNVFY